MKRIRFFFMMLGIVGLLGCQGFDEQLMLNQANRAHDSGDFAKAIRIYEKLLERDPDNKVYPDNALIYYELGVAYLDAKDRVSALKQVEALRRLGANDFVKVLEGLLKASDHQ